MTGLSAGSLLSDLAVLGAAASSPGALHRQVTIRTQWVNVALTGIPSPTDKPDPSTTTSPATASLQQHLRDAELRYPESVDAEDWWPSDPRAIVRFKYRGRRWRIHPGRHVDVLDVLETLADAAAATRPNIESALGFSGGDLIELALILMHQQVTALEAVWPPGPRPGPLLHPAVQAHPEMFGAEVRATPVQLTDAEVAAVRRQLAHDQLAAAAVGTLSPARAARAARWATCPGARHTAEPSVAAAIDTRQPGCPPTAALAVFTHHRRWAVPAGLVITHLQEALQHLCETYADDASDTRLHRAAKSRALRLMYGQPHIPEGAPAAPAPGSARPDATHREHTPNAEPNPHQPAPHRRSTTSDSDGRTRPAVHEASTTDNWTHPDAVFKFGRRLITVDVVPLLRLARAQETIEAAHARAMARSADDIMRLLPIKAPPADVIVLRLLLTHGLLDVKVPHTGGFTVLTLQVLHRILRDCEDNETGHDLLCQFVEDLNLLQHNIDVILAADGDDLWTHWQRYGGLLPVSAGHVEPHCAVVVAPTLYDTQWDRVATLEPFAQTCDAADLPRLATLPSVTLVGDQLSIVGPEGREAGYVSAPDTVLIISLDDAENAAASHSIASAMCTALHESGLAAAAAGRSGVYRLNVAITDDDQGRLTGHVEGPWNLTIASAFLRDAITDPATLHLALGRVLAAPHADRPAVSEALKRWNALPPAIILGVHATPARPHSLPRLVLASKASANRAAQRITAQLPRDAPPGTYTGPEAITLAKQTLYPATTRALTTAIAMLDGTRAVKAALAAADAAHQERAQRRSALDLALTTPQAASFRAKALSRPDDASLTRGLELLVERLLAHPGHGTGIIDRFDIADLSAICDDALLITIGADHASRSTGTLSIDVTDNGAFLTKVRGRDLGTESDIPPATNTVGRPAEPTLQVDAEAWLKAVRTDLLSTERPPPSLPNDDSAGEFRQILAGKGVPGRLRDLDNAMRIHVGCGFDAIVAVLATAAGWEDPADLPVTTAEALAIETRSWATAVEPSEITAAIRLLTLHGDATAADSNIWEQERRPHRLLLRPLVNTGDRLLLPRHICRALQEVLADFIGDGRVPWPDVPQPVKTAANLIRSSIGGKALERDAAAQAANSGLLFMVNLDEPAAAKARILNLPGEIDILAADPTQRILWVVEVKDHIMTASGHSLQQRVKKFAGRGAYEAKLVKKAHVIALHADAAAALLGISTTSQGSGAETGGSWTVQTLMATRRIEPAAFRLQPGPVPYVLVDHLAEHLAGTDRTYGLP